MRKLICSLFLCAPLLAAQQSIPPFTTTYGNFTNGVELNGSFGAIGDCVLSNGTGWSYGSCASGGIPGLTGDGLSPAGIIVTGNVAATTFSPSTPAGANQSLKNFTAFANLTNGYAILGDSTGVVSNAFGATVDANTAAYKIALALNMPLNQDYAIAGAECSDVFPLMITPNSLNPGPGYGTIAAGQGLTSFTFGINDSLNLGVSANAENFYTSACMAAAEWMAVARANKVMATDPVATLAGGFASSSAIINGGAISTSNGASATFPITTTGNKLHILYAAYEQGVVQSATYVSGGSVTGSAGDGCFVGTFNNSSTALATVKLTGTNTLAGAAITFNISHGSGATAAPTSAALTSGSATCSGTITISSTLSPGGAVGSTIGAATVTVDATPVTGLTAHAPGGIIFTSILGTTATMLDQAYTVGAGSHTVVVTTTNTGTFTIGGVLSQGAIGANPPAVAYGGVLHQNQCASDSTTGAYDTLNQTIASNLQADGMIAPFVDYRAAVGCGTAGTQANAGMSGSTTTMPDGTVCPASTSPGSHPNDCGYEAEAQKFRSTILPMAQNAGASSFSTNQGTGGQTVTASQDLQSFWRLTTNPNVNSGAWPIFSVYNHNGTGTVAGAFEYYDSTLNQWTLGDNGTITYASTPLGTEATFNKRFAFKNSGLPMTFAATGGATATVNVPSLSTTQVMQLQAPSGATPPASYNANTAFSLHEWGLNANVTTLNLVNSFAVQGGGTTTIYACEPNSGGPWTITAPSDFITSGQFQWPLANTANFNSAANQCVMFDIVRLDANGNANANKWVAKPYANLNLVNTFSMQQIMPTLKLTGSGCGAANAFPNSDGSGCTTPTAPLVGVTGSTIGGSPLALNACLSATGTVTGATTGMHVFGITPGTDPNSAGTQTYDWYGRVTSSNNVTIYVCALAAGTPAATLYNFLVQ